MKIFDVLVVGGGAAGLAAASKGGPTWVLAEKNSELAKKIYATGSGRCNYMNSSASGLPGGFTPQSLREELEAIGIYGKEEEEGRLYPRSGKAEDVALALIHSVRRSGAQVVTDFDACSVVRDGDIFTVKARDGRNICARKLILATGGKAGIQFGCEGTGLKMAASLGHKVLKPIPALTGLSCEEDLGPLAGVRVRGRLSFIKNRDGMSLPLACDSGEIQFTKNTVSGICTMNLSRFYRLEEGSSFFLMIDFFEELNADALMSLLSARCKAFPAENAGFILNTLVPAKLADFLLKGAGIDPKAKCGELKERQLLMLTASCKLTRLHVTGAGGWKDAQVTCGGIDLSEVDTQTMESRVVPGLYPVGEILDYDGPCGGYNLSWAFACGFTAAR